MKILELRFKNLNSLYGEWRIDFSAPEYTSNGIFSLTGPTGSGKSTILDAVCLALYGTTPRLGKISKGGNEIMSRQTGDCFAEVTFESQAGRFRCHWSQHRARKTAHGNLADSRHEIADAVSGQVLESKKRDVACVIEEKTGMDYERFTRSVLLAQGGFDTFLKADAEQKSTILEQITGTGIYTEISRRVHERQREERDRLNILQAETAGIVILSEEQESEVQLELQDAENKEALESAQSKEISQSILWLKGIEGLRSEMNELGSEFEIVQEELERVKPERARLIVAQRAAELDGVYGSLNFARNQHISDQKNLIRDQALLPDIESLARQKRDILTKAEHDTAKAKQDQKAAAPLIQKIRSMDQHLFAKKKTIEEADADCKKDMKLILVEKNLLEQEKKKIEKAEQDLTLVLSYLEQHGKDELIVSELAGIEEKLISLLGVEKELAFKNDLLKKNQKQLQACIKSLAAHSNLLKEAMQKLEAIQTQIEFKNKELTRLLGDQLLREYRAEKETLLREIAFQQKIKDLQSHRAQLQDGKPCPLCGAENHPFAKGNIPISDQSEKRIEVLSSLIHQAEQLEIQLKELERTEKEGLANVSGAEKQAMSAENEKQNLEKRGNDIADEIRKINTALGEVKQSLLLRLAPLGIQELPDSNVSNLLQILKARLETWREKLKKRSEIEKQMANFDSEIQRLQAVIGTREKALLEKQSGLNRHLEEHQIQNEERRNLFGDKTPDFEETRLGETVLASEGFERTARANYDEASQRLISAVENIRSLNERIQQNGQQLKQQETKFAMALQKAGFENEKLFVESRLSLPAREALENMVRQFDDRNMELQARKKDRSNRLIFELNKKVTESSLEMLEPQYENLDERLRMIRDQIAERKLKLAENKTARDRVKAKAGAIEVQKNECQRWEKLHVLIGSADGKKYRNFAQGLTFELMVSHANQQLIKMTDRYLLIRDKDQPLELTVADNYQAGEIRSTRNLSGGESFIVSLALALGLSKMASRKVRVDSLFLDEGFGTLDEEALETALETLSGLHQDGKLIGIISHVAALKERISTQISICPVSGGKSIMKGPGCSKIKANS